VLIQDTKSAKNTETAPKLFTKRRFAVDLHAGDFPFCLVKIMILQSPMVIAQKRRRKRQCTNSCRILRYQHGNRMIIYISWQLAVNAVNYAYVVLIWFVVPICCVYL
jgi:hypothetical protein